MKMHSQRFKDPLITRAQPITILGPLIEEALRLAHIRPDRDRILDRFMAGQPRIAVVHGSEDHPPSVGCRDVVRRLVRQIWLDGALPVEVSEAVPCEELSCGLPGAHYAFLSRNICAANLATVVEAHGYDAAFVLGACDKMFAGCLRALVEIDLARQRRKTRPFYSIFIPATVGREVRLDEEDRRGFDLLREKLSEEVSAELFPLLDCPVSAPVYEKVKQCLDRAFVRREILESEKDELERIVAKRASSPAANCASSEASIVNRLIVAAFGLVPRDMDLTTNPPSDRQLALAVRRLLQGIQKRERRISVAHLVKTNLQNAVTVWSASGGHPSWMLHLNYLAEALGVRMSPTLLNRKMSKVPCLLTLGDGEGISAAGIAAESDAGGNSGIDTLMRTLAEKRFIDDRASTLEGPWMQRIMEARSANGRYFHSTMTPGSPSCGLAEVRGNFSRSALVRLGASCRPDGYDRKIYLADFYLGRQELEAAAVRPGGIFDRLRNKVTVEDLYRTWAINWPSAGSRNGDLSHWNKRRLWDYLVEMNLLRVIFFVAGEGPRASGMPQVGLSGVNGGNGMAQNCILATDGRTAFGPETGMSIVHMVPEAIDSGGLAAIRTGDWIYLNLRRGELLVVTPARNAAGYRPVSARELGRRPEMRKRVQELERRRAAFLPSVRSVLDRVSSAAEGVSPITA